MPKTAGPTVPALRLFTTSDNCMHAMIKETYVVMFMFAVNQTKNIWYRRGSVRCAFGTGSMLQYPAVRLYPSSQRRPIHAPMPL